MTAYCVAEALRLKRTSAFLRDSHQVKPRIYDEALYAAYHLPLLPGSEEGSRVRSSPPVKSPGGESVLDKQIDATELRDHGEEYIDAPNTGNSSHAIEDGDSPSVPQVLRRRDSQPTAAELPAMYKYAESMRSSRRCIVTDCKCLCFLTELSSFGTLANDKNGTYLQTLRSQRTVNCNLVLWLTRTLRRKAFTLNIPQIPGGLVYSSLYASLSSAPND